MLIELSTAAGLTLMTGAAAAMFRRASRRSSWDTETFGTGLRAGEALTTAIGVSIAGIPLPLCTGNGSLWLTSALCAAFALPAAALIRAARHAAHLNAAAYQQLRFTADNVRNRTPAVVGTLRPADPGWLRAMDDYGIASISFTHDGQLAELLLTGKAKYHADEAAELIHTLTLHTATLHTPHRTG